MNLKIILVMGAFLFSQSVLAIPDYYHILGVPRNASQEQIVTAYRSLIRKYHPDLNNNSKTSTEIAKKINEAYQNLKNETARAKYDVELERQPKPRPANERPQATERSSASPFRKVDPKTEDVFRGTGGRSSWERDSASEQARRRANGRPFAEAEAKKYEWQNFDQPKPESTRPQAREQQAKSEAPKPEAPRNPEVKPASTKPATVPASPHNPNLNIYKTPKCSKEFLGTVIDILT